MYLKMNSRNYVLGALIPLFISVCHGQTLSIGVAPSSLTIYPGQQNVSLTVTAGSGTYAGPITIALTGLPSGVTASPLVLTEGNSGVVMLSATVAAGQEGFSATAGPTMVTSWTASVTVAGGAGATQATAPLSLIISESNSAFAPAASAINLPVVTINTNGAPITSGTIDVPGTVTITSANGQTSYLPNASDSDNTAKFHVHGHSTALMPKLAYHMKLTTSLDLLNVMGLQCPYITNGSGKPTCDKSKSFVLLANYDDKTFLRDWSASALANAIPIGNGYLNSPPESPTPSGTSALMPWATHSLFVELYLNGVYEGNYQLIEEVKVDSHRINIAELTETETGPTQVTGGYLMEIDVNQDEAFVFQTPQGLPIGLIDPDFTPDPEVPEQTTYISNYVIAAENALFGSSFTDPVLGWRAYFDEASAINFYIVNDVMGNVDGGDFLSSDYLYKNVNNPLLYMGPVWDFDISSGNVNFFPIVSAVQPWMQIHGTWYVQWLTDPGFRADLVTQWNTLKKNGVFTAWLASIRQQATGLEQSQANNFGRWPMQGLEVWPNPQAAGSYDSEVNYLINWVTLRIAYLDSLFNTKTATSVTLAVNGGALRAGAPVTLTAQVTGTGSPTGEVTFLGTGGVLIGVAPLSAGGTATLTLSSLPAGANSLQAIYNGDNTNALASSANAPVTLAAALVSTVTSVIGPVSAGFSAAVVGTSGTGVPTGTVTFTVDAGAGSAVTLDGTGQASYPASSLSSGTHTLTVSYSGDANYAAGAAAPVTFQTGLTSQTIAFSPATLTYTVSTGSFAVFATSSSGLAVALSSTTPSICTVSGGTVNILAVGACIVQASQAGNATYAPAVSVLVNFTIAPATQAISFTIPNHTSSDAPFALQVTSSSGLAATFSVVSGPATVSGSTATLTGVGQVVMMAAVPGNTAWAAGSATATFNVTLGTATVTSDVNAADYATGTLSINSYATMFGSSLAGATASGSATSTAPVAGVSISVADSKGNSLPAPLYYVSFNQIDLIVPPGLAAGKATLTISNGSGTTTTFAMTLGAVAPAIFTADSSGTGAPAAFVATYTGTQSQTTDAFQCGGAPYACGPATIALAAGTQVYLELFGTGISGTAASNDSATIGGIQATIQYAGPQGGYPALDQVNVLIPASLAQSGLVTLQLIVGGVAANPIQLVLQ